MFFLSGTTLRVTEGLQSTLLYESVQTNKDKVLRHCSRFFCDTWKDMDYFSIKLFYHPLSLLSWNSTMRVDGSRHG